MLHLLLRERLVALSRHLCQWHLQQSVGERSFPSKNTTERAWEGPWGSSHSKGTGEEEEGWDETHGVYQEQNELRVISRVREERHSPLPHWGVWQKGSSRTGNIQERPEGWKRAFSFFFFGWRAGTRGSGSSSQMSTGTAGRVSGLGWQEVEQHHKPSQQHTGNISLRFSRILLAPVSHPGAFPGAGLRWCEPRSLLRSSRGANSKKSTKLERENHLSSHLYPNPFKATSFQVSLTPPCPLQKVQNVSGEREKEKKGGEKPICSNFISASVICWVEYYWQMLEMQARGPFTSHFTHSRGAAPGHRWLLGTDSYLGIFQSFSKEMWKPSWRHSELPTLIYSCQRKKKTENHQQQQQKTTKKKKTATTTKTVWFNQRHKHLF